jgi:hypothetical protein
MAIRCASCTACGEPRSDEDARIHGASLYANAHTDGSGPRIARTQPYDTGDFLYVRWRTYALVYYAYIGP